MQSYIKTITALLFLTFFGISQTALAVGFTTVTMFEQPPQQVIYGDYQELAKTPAVQGYVKASEPKIFVDKKEPVNAGTAVDDPLTVPIRIAGDVDRACADETVRYTVGYKNLTPGAIDGTTVTVRLPKDMLARDISSGTYDENTGTITLSVGTIEQSDEGRLYFDAYVIQATTPSRIAAELSYTDRLGQTHREQTMATLTHSGCIKTSVAAAVFFSNSFFPHTFLGWFLLIALLIAMMLLSRKYFYKKKAHGHH